MVNYARSFLSNGSPAIVPAAGFLSYVLLHSSLECIEAASSLVLQ